MTIHDCDRQPTPDEHAGMDWWNALSVSERARWLDVANTAIAAEAWAMCKAGYRPHS
jgi:hypothetical protein